MHCRVVSLGLVFAAALLYVFILPHVHCDVHVHKVYM